MPGIQSLPKSPPSMELFPRIYAKSLPTSSAYVEVHINGILSPLTNESEQAAAIQALFPNADLREDLNATLHKTHNEIQTLLAELEKFGKPLPAVLSDIKPEIEQISRKLTVAVDASDEACIELLTSLRIYERKSAAANFSGCKSIQDFQPAGLVAVLRLFILREALTTLPIIHKQVEEALHLIEEDKAEAKARGLLVENINKGNTFTRLRKIASALTSLIQKITKLLKIILSYIKNFFERKYILLCFIYHKITNKSAQNVSNNNLQNSYEMQTISEIISDLDQETPKEIYQTSSEIIQYFSLKYLAHLSIEKYLKGLETYFLSPHHTSIINAILNKNIANTSHTSSKEWSQEFRKLFNISNKEILKYRELDDILSNDYDTINAELNKIFEKTQNKKSDQKKGNSPLYKNIKVDTELMQAINSLKEIMQWEKNPLAKKIREEKIKNENEKDIHDYHASIININAAA